MKQFLKVCNVVIEIMYIADDPPFLFIPSHVVFLVFKTPTVHLHKMYIRIRGAENSGIFKDKV